MSVIKKFVKVGEEKSFDINAIYARVIGLLSSSGDININDVLAHQLAPVRTSMFSDKGMRIAKNKAVLNKALQVEVSCRNLEKPDVLKTPGDSRYAMRLTGSGKKRRFTQSKRLVPDRKSLHRSWNG
jgi:hypothetical protein